MPDQDEFRALCSAELGKPYIWGASGPESYDCSGLAQVLLERLDLDPPGDQTAEGLYRHFLRQGRSRAVSLSESTLGDLVFFGGDTAITHVGLGWGSGEMIEAGGGGRRTTTVAIARSQGAEVRVRAITRRRDRVAILRPAALQWADEVVGSALESVQEFGSYEGTPLTEWLSDGRHMQLKRPFAYIGAGERWPVPIEAIVDGASIPRPFWSVIGGPFEGQYRDASIVHDYYCDMKTRAWRATHRMFHDAMRCSGVGVTKAKIMFYAVYRFGPRWTLPSLESLGLESSGLESLELPAGVFAGAGAAPEAADSFDGPSATEDVQRIATDDPGLDEIEALADSHASG